MMPAIPLRRILLASLALNLLGVWWGLPGKWAPIELLPEYVMGGLQQHFSHGWFDAYPPLHYFVLTVAMSPFMALSWCCRVSLDDSYTRMVLVNRLVSVIQRDLVIQRFSSRLDTILGSPTLWQQPEGPASRLRDMDTCRSSNDWCLRRHSGGIDGRRSITHDCQIL